MRGLIYQHLKTVAPSLAVEFQNTHLCCSETAPLHLLGELQRDVLTIANIVAISKVEDGSGGKQEQSNNRKRLGKRVGKNKLR